MIHDHWSMAHYATCLSYFMAFLELIIYCASSTGTECNLLRLCREFCCLFSSTNLAECYQHTISEIPLNKIASYCAICRISQQYAYTETVAYGTPLTIDLGIFYLCDVIVVVFFSWLQDPWLKAGAVSTSLSTILPWSLQMNLT